MYDGDPSTPGGRLGAWTESLFVDHAVLRLAWDNWGVVVPGKLYRCNHPTPGRLARAKRRHGLVTLINLRGHRRCGSDALSRQAAGALGLDHIDMAFESRGAPHRDRVLRFADIYAGLRAPALMHCKSGADRTGLAAGLALLLEGRPARVAMRQLSWRYGHVRRSRTGVLDAFFLRYATAAEGRLPFLDWVDKEYDEAALKREFVAGGLAAFLNDTLLRRE